MHAVSAVCLQPFRALWRMEFGCARISMIAQEQNASPSIGRIQMRETDFLQIATSSFHRQASPVRQDQGLYSG